MPDARPTSVAEELRAFEIGIKNPTEEAFVEAVNHLLAAALYAQTIDLCVRDGGRVWAKVGSQDNRPIEVPHGVGTFRTVLARIGIICGDASLKATLPGKAKALLIRARLIPDAFMTHQRSGYLEYLAATIRDQPGSPLYVLDANLQIKTRSGGVAWVAIKMNNQSPDFKLSITRH